MAKKKVSAKSKLSKKEVEKKVSPKKVPWAPLSGGFMIISILGLVVSGFMMDKSPSWGFAFIIVFAVMFIASLISMRYGPIRGLK